MKEYVLKNIQEMKDDYDEIPNMKVFKITNALTQKASKEIEEALGDVEIKKFFHLEDGIDTIKKIYKENKVDGNNYSMYIKYKLNSRYTLLLSGDALLNKEKSASLRIGKEKIIFQISHHGSFPSNDFFINKYGKNIKYAFVSFGFQNTYRHPDFRTIEIIGNKKIKFVTCFKDDNAYNDKINEIVLKD
ncbi:MAG: hypothetical protein LBV69_09720 [Bacteroidales bacterium]|jgi:beta-lactamase superfamily II metal-dependent hydrolase|nr:hypothetical protein [Bacteroidales bacterium]